MPGGLSTASHGRVRIYDNCRERTADVDGAAKIKRSIGVQAVVSRVRNQTKPFRRSQVSARARVLHHSLIPRLPTDICIERRLRLPAPFNAGGRRKKQSASANDDVPQAMDATEGDGEAMQGNDRRSRESGH
uniref:Uncharacterized protein n=1 Tax=Plectus sambesii TaxID=2011161 RepID=A0A914WZ81_9BILA